MVYIKLNNIQTVLVEGIDTTQEKQVNCIVPYLYAVHPYTKELEITLFYGWIDENNNITFIKWYDENIRFTDPDFSNMETNGFTGEEILNAIISLKSIDGAVASF